MAEDQRPTGPFGFPRLTSLGPFVEPVDIHPNHNTSTGIYDISKIRDVQPQTAHDTLLFFAEGRESLIGAIENIPIFEYKKESLGEILTNSEFSGTLIEYAERDSLKIKSKIEFRDFPEQDAENLCAWLEFEDSDSAYERCGIKVKEDIDRVKGINDTIRDTREYFPPTIFPVGTPNLDTIDGAHRIVALASIIGTEENIWVWEIQNHQEVFDEIEKLM